MTVWTPKGKPPVLGKFCHLSIDAQKVMAALYRDFHQRKAELLSAHQNTFYDQEKYGVPTNRQCQRETIEKQDHSGPIYSSYSDVASPDQSNNSGSPPVETQSYRLLTQFCNEENRELSVRKVNECDGEGNNNNVRCTTYPLLPGKFGLKGDTISRNPSAHESMHTDPASTKCISPAIEHSNLNTHEVSEDDRSQVDSSYDGSQVLFSQDCDTIIKNSDKTRQGYVNMSMETSDSVNNVQLCGPNMSTVHSNRDFVFDPVVIPTDSTTCGIQIIQEPFDLSERHYSSKRPRMDTGTTKSVPGKSKTKGNVSNKDCDIRKFLNKGNTNKRFHPHTIVESSNVFNSNQNFSVSASSTITCNTSTVDSEESPYPFAQHSNNPALNIRKETQEWKKLNPHSTKFKVSVKPSKKSENSYKHGIMSVNHLSVTQLKHVLSLILDSNEVIISLVYNNGSTQLRDCLFGSDKSKNNGKMKQKCDVDSIVLLHNGIIYMFPIVNSVTDHCEVLREFFPALLRKCEIRKIGLHVKELLIAFVKFLGTEKFIDLSWTIMDCSIAWWLLDPDHPISNLEQLLSLLGLPQQTPCDSCIDALLEDMTLLSSAMQRLDQELHRKDLWMLYLCLETPLVNVIARMELRCLTVSTHTLLLFSTLLKRNLTRLDQRAHKAVGHVFVLNSHQQLRQVLFEELRLDSKISGKTKLAKTSVTKEMSTSESVLNQLSSVHPLPSIVLEYRQLQKLKSAYVDGILSCVINNSIQTHWDQTSAATGRLTSYQPNIQAIPKIPITISDCKQNYICGSDQTGEKSVEIYARDAFIASKNFSFIAVDFQQIELRILGHLANDTVLLNILNDPQTPDIFIVLTSQWLNKPFTEVSDTDRERTKRIVYSVMYGVGKEKLSQYLKCKPDDAKAIMDSFLLKFPAVNQFTKSCIEFCKEKEYTMSIFKRRRLFSEINGRNRVLRAQAERQCVNFCVQGSAADICKAAMLQVQKCLEVNSHLDARLLIQIHDELLLEVADEHLNTVAGLVKSVMEDKEKLCGSVVDLKVSIPVSVNVGKTWGHMVPWASSI